MRGFCGWSGLGAAESSATNVVAPMASAEPSAAMVGDAHWAIKSGADEVDRPELHSGDGAFAVVEGRPTTRNEALAALIDAHGLARACSERYRRIGPGFLSELHGAFSLVISIGNGARVLVATDRIGVNPVWYSLQHDGLAFATRLRYLRSCGALDLSVDPQSVYDYLYFHVIPGPQTIYRNVFSLVPGSYLEICDGRSRTDRYWRVEYSNEEARVDRSALESDFMDVLRQCIGLEAENSRDVGCFLSGGTDSSTLTGVLSEVSDQPVRTYSIGFDQTGFDEMEYARLAARHFRTEHHEYYVTPEDIIDLVPRIARVYGQPFGNSSVVPTYFCAKMAKADGVDKLLGGDGGDELFGGNERYATQLLFSWYGRIPRALREKLLEPVVDGFPFRERIMPVRKLGRYIEQARIPMPDRLQTYSYLHLLGKDTILEQAFMDSLDTEHSLRALQEMYADTGAKNLVNKMLALDLKLTLSDNDLPKVTQMCELAGIHAGYPFLREPMVEFSSKLPADLKVKRLKIRYFFKKALRDFLPPEIIHKQKHGFGLPFGDWLVSHDGLRELAFDSMSALKRRGIVRTDFVDDLIGSKLQEHPNYFGGLIWILMILEQWYDSQ